MSSTRYSQQPLQIYQDPVSSFDKAPMPSSRAANLSKKSPLRPIKNAASRNIVFNAPQPGPSKQSPLKPSHRSSSSPSRAPFGNKLNMIAMPPPGEPTRSTDSIEKKQPLLSKFKPQKALFTTFSSSTKYSFKGLEKENYPQTYYQGPPPQYISSDFSLEGLYGQKPPLKRSLMDAAPIHESRPFKKVRTEDEEQDVMELKELPSPDSFPPLHDDGTKPQHSYAQLIGMSILRAPNRRLTLAQIYKWISDTYSFYSASDAGWQNSIRHNLSLNKAFIKQERPKDDPGKGNYWVIQPGMEHQFIKEKLSRKLSVATENAPLLSASVGPVQLECSLPPPSLKPLVPALPQELSRQPSHIQKESFQTKPPDLSSDATIPASDAVNDPEQDDDTEAAPSSPLIRSSPPAAMMRSSPPVPHQVLRRQDTPPPVPRFPSSSRSRSHKRKFASMDDSGYFSSLDSSAMRGNHRLLTSEADRPRIKRGRAEEEIARLRGSSYDSPSKGRTMHAPISSSPLRRSLKKSSYSQMLPPLTPVLKLKAPVRPPPSVSPNTNLRMHRDRVREMVGSPLRDSTNLDENIPWSPAFNLDDTSYMFQDCFSADFDIFADTNLLTIPGMGSPEKRSAKRPRLDRSRSANILADISNPSSYSNLKNVTSTPILKFTPSMDENLTFNSPANGLGLSGLLGDSPSKLLCLESPSKIASPAFNLGGFDLQDQEFFDSEFLEEDVTRFEGVDIMQGFQKIGSGAQTGKSTPKPSTRPGLGRSYSTRF